MSGAQQQSGWVLESQIDGGRRIWRTEVLSTPFVIGRHEGCDLRVSGAAISGRHAELVQSVDGLMVRDLGSKNGTFVNRDRVLDQVALRAGDVLHIADQEFQLLRGGEDEPRTATIAIDLDLVDGERSRALHARELREMIDSGRLGNVYQPVVELDSGRHAGFEALGRGYDERLPESPEELFELARVVDLESELCEALRRAVPHEAERLPAGATVFLNTRPREIEDVKRLVDSLAAVRRALPTTDLVLELHEMAVADGRDLLPLRGALHDLDIEIAFDDFGKGRDRFLELAELTPRYLKFDRRMIEGLGALGESERGIRRRMLATIVAMVRDEGVETIAEGIESERERDACLELGFDLGQGFFWGRPAEAESWR